MMNSFVISRIPSPSELRVYLGNRSYCGRPKHGLDTIHHVEGRQFQDMSVLGQLFTLYYRKHTQMCMIEVIKSKYVSFQRLQGRQEITMYISVIGQTTFACEQLSQFYTLRSIQITIY